MPKLGLDLAELHACWDEIAASGHFTEGKYVKLFEEEVSNWSDMYAVAVSNAGSGLFSIMRCLDIPRGPVMVPNNTFFATGAMVQEAGFPIYLADCSVVDFSMSLKTVEDAWRKGTVAVVLTHVGGGLAMEYNAIADFCRSKGVPLIEDAAHAMGAKRRKITAGKLGEAAVFSLYPTKAMPAGEGGVIVTTSRELYNKLKVFRNYGKIITDGLVFYTGKGFNFRMDEWTAAIAYLQMKRLPDIMRRRINQAHRLKSVVPPWYMWPDGESNWYKYPVKAGDADWAKRRTGKIYARTDQLRSMMGVSLREFLPVSDLIAEEHICLPLDEDTYDGMATHEITAFLEGR